MLVALGAGLVLGFTVGAQPGPMSLFLVRSTLRGSLRTGLAIGAGIAVIDVLYAAIAAAGLAPVLGTVVVRVVLVVLGSAVLLALGLRTLWSAFRVRAGGEWDDEVRTPRRAFVTSLGATATNPLTIALWTGGFAAAGAAAHVHSGPPRGRVAVRNRPRQPRLVHDSQLRGLGEPALAEAACPPRRRCVRRACADRL